MNDLSPRSLDDAATAIARRAHGGSMLDGPGFAPERLLVRGRDLNDLIGAFDPVEAFALVMWGSIPDPARREELEAMLRLVSTSVSDRHRAFRAATAAIKAGGNVPVALIAGLAAGLDDVVAELAGGCPPQEREAIAYFGALPNLLLAACGRMPLSVNQGRSFSRRLLYALSSRREGEMSWAELRAFDAVLVSLQAGFGVLAPTVMLPRIAAGTRADLRLCLIAGLAGSGSAHVGACDDAMRLFDPISAADSDESAVEALLDRQIRGGGRVPGFGHPLFCADPRVPRIRAYLDEIAFSSPALSRFDALRSTMLRRFRLQPNIDSIAAAVFSGLALPACAGTGIFLCMRSAAMMAHSREALDLPRFGVRSRTARTVITKLNLAATAVG